MTISIITVALNNESTIKRTIESILSQTYRDIEYILVDGGSTDGTLEIARAEQNRFNGRMKIYELDKSSIYEAANFGIRNSSGEIVGMLNADDIFTSEKIISLVAGCFTGNNADIEMLYADIHYFTHPRTDLTTRYYSAKDFTPKLLKFGFAPPHPSLYVRRDVFTTYGYYRENYKLAADFEFFVRTLWNTNLKAVYLPVDMVAMQTGGISTKWRNRLYTNWIEKRRALRENNVDSSYALLAARYIFSLKHFFKK